MSDYEESAGKRELERLERELRQELANNKQEYRRNQLPEGTARYLALEIMALELMLKAQ